MKTPLMLQSQITKIKQIKLHYTHRIPLVRKHLLINDANEKISAFDYWQYLKHNFSRT